MKLGIMIAVGAELSETGEGFGELGAEFSELSAASKMPCLIGADMSALWAGYGPFSLHKR